MVSLVGTQSNRCRPLAVAALMVVVVESSPASMERNRRRLRQDGEAHLNG